MANANVNTKKMTKVIGATLEMDQEELYTLLVILSKVGGDPFKSYRRHAERMSNALYDALYDVGYDFDQDLFNDVKDSVCSNNRAIYFNNKE